MTNSCKHVFEGGAKCELPIDNPKTDLCHFHDHLSRQKVIDRGGPFLWDYVNADRDKSVNLRGVTFKNVIFSREQFNDGISIDFSGAQFTDCKFINWTINNASFRKCMFKDTSFKDVTFEGNTASFKDSEFECDDTIFDKIRFHLGTDDLSASSVNFDNCTITSRRHLFSSCIIRASKLTMAECKLDTSFLQFFVVDSQFDSVYLETLTLRGVRVISLIGFRFKGTFHFNQYVDSENFVPTLYLYNINFSVMNYVHFNRVNLKEAWFASSEIEAIRFMNCTWLEKNGHILLREDQVDEASNVKNPESLILQYTQLKKNFEDGRDYIGAGDWFYREMEARRRQARLELEQGKKKAIHLFVLNSYKFLSNYGESYTKPLFYLGLVLILFAPLHMLSGFVMDEQHINYAFAKENIFTWQHLTDFGKSLVASFSAMSLQGGKIVTFKGLSSNLLYIFQFLITVILVPLFLLALRRKFRR